MLWTTCAACMKRQILQIGSWVLRKKFDEILKRRQFNLENPLHSLFFVFSKHLNYITVLALSRGLPGSSAIKNLPTMQELQETQVWSLSQEDPLEQGMATHSSVLAWRIPWTEEPGGLHSPWGCKELDSTELIWQHH